MPRMPIAPRRYRTIVIALLLASLAPATPVNARETPWQLIDAAKAHPDYRGAAPKKSDVIFSTRFKRDNAAAAAKDFGATRIEWVYTTDAAYVKSLKASAGWFGGSLNANVRLPSDDGYARDFEGNILVAPWMKAWGAGAKWITTTHPDSVKALKEEAAKIIAAGGDSIQVDDPLFQLHSSQWGGDFNKVTLQGFNRYLSSYPDKNTLTSLGLTALEKSDYREYLKSRHGIKDNKDYLARYRSLPTTNLWTRYLRGTVRDFFTDFRGHLNGLRPKIPLSMNLSLDKPHEGAWHFFLAEFADYAISETPIANVEELVARSATARALAIGFVPSIMPRGTGENKLAIATLYALGAQPLVPWDVYHGNDEKGQAKRFFGTPEHYGELYAFVRKNPQLFDGTETTAVVGIPIPVDKFRNDDTTRLVRRLVESQVPFAFVLTGGTERKFKMDSSRVRHFQLLISVNADADFSSDDLKILRGGAVPHKRAGELTDTAIRDLAPLTAVGRIGAVKVYPRANPAAAGRRLIVHVIDETRAHASGPGQDCTRRVGVKKSALPGAKVVKATWYAGDTVKALPISDGERESAVTIQECRLWGVVSFDLQ